MGGTCGTNGEKRNVYRLLVGKPEGKRPLGSYRETNNGLTELSLSLNRLSYPDSNNGSQNCRVSGNCASSGILKTRKHDVSETRIVSILR
jgi:hypothetical protein